MPPPRAALRPGFRWSFCICTLSTRTRSASTAITLPCLPRYLPVITCTVSPTRRVCAIGVLQRGAYLCASLSLASRAPQGPGRSYPTGNWDENQHAVTRVRGEWLRSIVEEIFPARETPAPGHRR